MKRLQAVVVALSICAAAAPAAQAKAKAHARRVVRCCKAPAGTAVQVELVDPISTKTAKTGDSFALKLAAPLIVDGRILLRAGTPGEGAVIEAAKPGLGGKAAKLVLAARYVGRGKVRVPLDGLQLAASGRGRVMTAQAVGLTGIAFAPLGIVAFAIRGGDVVFPAGTTAQAKLSSDMELASLGRAPKGSAPAVVELPPAGAIDIPPPPPGQGQVVFFRPKSLLGTGQWFNVREGGKALGKLSNGAYFVQAADPGLHTYTAKAEPEFNDKLVLQIDPGETYFVEGMLTKGLVIGAADLTPSDRGEFAKASHNLKLASAPDAPEPVAQQSDTTAVPAQ